MTDRPQRRGLGRGLGSLIPTAPPEEPAAPTTVPPAGEPTEGPGATAASGTPPTASGASLSGAAAVSRETSSEAAPDASVDSSDTGATSTEAVPTPASADDRPSNPTGAYFAEIPVEQVVPNPRQPREVFDEEAMAELVHSVREVGLLQPVVVRRTGETSYELVMGERRWRASREAGLEAVPAIVRETGDDRLLRDALLENLHRSQLNPLEEANAYQQLLDDFECTHDELAERIGRSRPQISNMLRLLRLSPPVQRRVASGVLSAGHARALLGVADPAAQDRLAGRVVAEGISVRGLEEIVAVGDAGDSADGARPRARRARPSAPGLSDIEDRLADRLDTRVTVTLGKSKGRIAIDFASVSDLERLVSIIDPRRRDDRPI